MPFRDEQGAPANTLPRQPLIFAAVLSLALVGVFATTMPFARQPTGNTDFLVPAYAVAIFLLEGMTAALLFALYKAQRSFPLLLLASGYLFGALMLPAWALTFPGAFSDLGITFGLQETAAIAAMRRLAFPAFVLAFALAPAREAGPKVIPVAIGVCAVAVALVGAVLIFADHLPPLMFDDAQPNPLWRVIPPLAMMLYAVDIVVLLRFGRPPLNLWVCTVLFALAIELLLIAFLGGATRLSVGWWAGRIYGLVAASIVLLFLIAQTTFVYTRLARTVAAEWRTREKRLTAMEAFSAMIAHEINQPLASMVTNADAALHWLARPEPRMDKADAALRRIVEDGHRASDIIRGIRTMFSKDTRERAELDIAALVERSVRGAAAEARHDDVNIAVELLAPVPPVVGNAVQLEHVMRNLLENAIDAVRTVHGRPRRVVVRVGPGEPDDVHVCVTDNGLGIPSDMTNRLFDPFVSTKPGGMGMGLMFCRAVVEAHGGRIWAETSVPNGAAIHVSLPADVLLMPGECGSAQLEDTR